MIHIYKPSLSLVAFINKHHFQVGIKNGYFSFDDIMFDYIKREISVGGFNKHKNLNFELKFDYNYDGTRAIGIVDYFGIEDRYRFYIGSDNGVYKQRRLK